MLSLSGGRYAKLIEKRRKKKNSVGIILPGELFVISLSANRKKAMRFLKENQPSGHVPIIKKKKKC